MTTIKEQLISQQVAIFDKVKELQKQLEFSRACAERFTEVEPVISETLSKLNLELVDIRLMTNGDPGDGRYRATVVARSVKGFKYLKVNPSVVEDYEKLQNKAEKYRKTLYDALMPYRPYFINFNPYSFLGGPYGARTGETMNITIELKSKK